MFIPANIPVAKLGDRFPDYNTATANGKSRRRGIEVTQAIQNIDKSVPPIEGKQTAVRVHLLAGIGSAWSWQ